MRENDWRAAYRFVKTGVLHIVCFGMFLNLTSNSGHAKERYSNTFLQICCTVCLRVTGLITAWWGNSARSPHFSLPVFFFVVQHSNQSQHQVSNRVQLTLCLLRDGQVRTVYGTTLGLAHSIIIIGTVDNDMCPGNSKAWLITKTNYFYHIIGNRPQTVVDFARFV